MAATVKVHADAKPAFEVLGQEGFEGGIALSMQGLGE